MNTHFPSASDESAPFPCASDESAPFPSASDESAPFPCARDMNVSQASSVTSPQNLNLQHPVAPPHVLSRWLRDSLLDVDQSEVGQQPKKPFSEVNNDKSMLAQGSQNCRPVVLLLGRGNSFTRGQTQLILLHAKRDKCHPQTDKCYPQTDKCHPQTDKCHPQTDNKLVGDSAVSLGSIAVSDELVPELVFAGSGSADGLSGRAQAGAMVNDVGGVWQRGGATVNDVGVVWQRGGATVNDVDVVWQRDGVNDVGAVWQRDGVNDVGAVWQRAEMLMAATEENVTLDMQEFGVGRGAAFGEDRCRKAIEEEGLWKAVEACVGRKV